MSKEKQKGTKAETDVAKCLNDNGIEAWRNPPAGTRDVGDIRISLPIVIEVKDHARLDLATWVSEAQVEKVNAKARVAVVWHKKRGKSNPSGWYVTMTGQDFIELIKMIY